MSEFEPRPSGYIGSSVARMIYGVRNNKHSLDMAGRSYEHVPQSWVDPQLCGEMTMARGQRSVSVERRIRQAVLTIRSSHLGIQRTTRGRWG